MKNLQQIKQIIHQSDPSILGRNVSVYIPKPFGGIINYRDETITLADVVSAICKKYNEETDKELGSQMEFEQEIVHLVLQLWILDNNNLDQQSPETWEALIKLLK